VRRLGLGLYERSQVEGNMSHEHDLFCVRQKKAALGHTPRHRDDTCHKTNCSSTMTSPPVVNATLAAAVASLVSSGATWKAVKDIDGASVHTLADIRYGQDSPFQSVDVYFPDDALHDNSKRPVYIHIHGGGWSRGGKASPFYGGPAMCQNAAASGCIAVAPGYRLGKYPEFVHDAANAIKWAQDNIESVGGDLSNVFLSGHSAGGHIASLLILRHSCFLAPLGIPLDFFRGVVLVSGVYDLFSPLRSAPLDAKNKWFVLAYVTPAFGTDEKLRREASPLLLLEPEKETSTLGRVALSALSISRRYSSADKTAISKDIDESIELNTCAIPSVLILNATYDMGLQENGELFRDALSKYTDVKYVLVKGADHASICWNEVSSKEVADFIKAKSTQVEPPNAEESPNVTVVKNDTKRRGKRDKMPMTNDSAADVDDQ